MSKSSLKQPFKPHPSKAKRLPLEELANSSQYRIIDVRSERMFHSTPHIKGAINISKLDDLLVFCRQNPSKKILLACDRGSKASQYGNYLVEMGFDQIYFLDMHLAIIQEYLPFQDPQEPNQNQEQGK